MVHAGSPIARGKANLPVARLTIRSHATATCPITASNAVVAVIAADNNKNPYTQAAATASSASFVEGQISITASGTSIVIRGCIVKDCTDPKYQLTHTVTVE